MGLGGKAPIQSVSVYSRLLPDPSQGLGWSSRVRYRGSVVVGPDSYEGRRGREGFCCGTGLHGDPGGLPQT